MHNRELVPLVVACMHNRISWQEWDEPVPQAALPLPAAPPLLPAPPAGPPPPTRSSSSGGGTGSSDHKEAGVEVVVSMSGVTLRCGSFKSSSGVDLRLSVHG
jgi:hypothetical protein